jgi:hypothetical protein
MLLTVFITKPSPWVIGMAVPAPACHCVVPFIPWYYILDESLSANIEDPAPVEPSDYRRAGERGSAVTNRTSPTSALSNWPASPFIAGALAIIICENAPNSDPIRVLCMPLINHVNSLASKGSGFARK